MTKEVFVQMSFYSKINPMQKSSANSSDVGIKKDDRLLADNVAGVSEVRRVDFILSEKTIKMV